MQGSSGRVNILEGSIRSGKTIVSLLRWFIFVAFAPRGGELVMVGRTRDALFRNVIKPMQDPSLFGALATQVQYTNGASTATILGRTVHILGASDAKAEKVIRGMTVSGAYVDEVTVIPEEFFTQLLGRMSVLGAQLFGTTNPDSPGHWLKKKFLNRVAAALLDDWTVWHFELDDNPSLSESYKDAIKSEYTGLWYRRFIKGEWVAAEGAIYDMWDETLHVLPEHLRPPLSELLCVAADYGTTNPTHALALAITREDRPRLIVVDEWRYSAGEGGQRWTDSQLATGMEDWMAGLEVELGLVPRWVFVDPAAASFITQLQQDKVPNIVTANNEVAYGLKLVAKMFHQQRLIVMARCKHLIEEVPGYSWDPKASEKGEDVPLKVADHGLDALRYAVTSSERYWLRHIRSLA